MTITHANHGYPVEVTCWPFWKMASKQKGRVHPRAASSSSEAHTSVQPTKRTRCTAWGKPGTVEHDRLEKAFAAWTAAGRPTKKLCFRVDWCIPKNVWNRRTNRNSANAIAITACPGRISPIPREAEDMFVAYIKHEFSAGRGWSPQQIQEHAVRFFLLSPASVSQWYYGRFLRRHPELASFDMETHERRRANATTKEVFSHYFEVLENAYTELKELNGVTVTADIVFNSDETGFNPGKRTRLRAVGPKGSALKKITAADSSCHVSKLTTVSADGILWSHSGSSRSTTHAAPDTRSFDG
jgi:hypothetical protein